LNGYERNQEGWRPYANPDQEKVDLINDTLGPGARNVACDLDRVQYDNVHKRLVFLEIETESQRDPWPTSRNGTSSAAPAGA